MVLKSTFAELDPGAGAFSIMILTRARAMLPVVVQLLRNAPATLETSPLQRTTVYSRDT